MDKDGPLIVIEDDPDDQELFRWCYKKTGCANDLVFFDDPVDALAYLSRDDVFPFLVVSDINMPKLNGFELREKVFMDPPLRHKCIPYLFFTTGSSKFDITEAYELSVQGFFMKPPEIKNFEKLIAHIIHYWKCALAPHG